VFRKENHMPKKKPKVGNDYPQYPDILPRRGHTWYSADFGSTAESSDASDKHDGLGALLPKQPSILKRLFDALSGELAVVLLIGLVSTTTAWTAIQASFHGGTADGAYGEYQTSMAEANNLWITAEVKYRADLLTWDTGVGGSYEYYTYAVGCKEAVESGEIVLAGGLPDCKPYMEAVYDPYGEAWDAAQPLLETSEIETGHSNRLQMLTGIFAVSLFLLGVTSPMKKRKNAAYLIAFAATLWATGVAILASIPIIIL
jgi:hypothetical protein